MNCRNRYIRSDGAPLVKEPFNGISFNDFPDNCTSSIVLPVAWKANNIEMTNRFSPVDSGEGRNFVTFRIEMQRAIHHCMFTILHGLGGKIVSWHCLVQ